MEIHVTKMAHWRLKNIVTAARPNTVNAILRHGRRSNKLDSEQNRSISS